METIVFKSDKGNAITTSLMVAQKFGKRHADVLRAVDNLECTQNFSQRNFAFVENQLNGAVKERICIMTRDGFSFLCMGFTGKKAAEFKEIFIEAFNKMEQALKLQLPQTFAEALQLAANQAKEIEQQQKQLIEQAPKVHFAESILSSENSVLVAELARILQQNGLVIGQNRLFAKLRNDGYLLSKGNYYNMPSQKSMDLKIMEVVERAGVTIGEKKVITKTTMITAKGLSYFVNKYIEKP